MPNVWTHLIFGRELLKKMGLSELLATEEDQRVFHLGCQGPDFLFYHNFWPWKKDKRVSELGNRIHHEHCGPFLIDVARQTRTRPVTDQAVIYLIGFLTHHVLDRNMHPYINYNSGFKKWNHQRFEVILDTLMAKKFLGIETWKTPVWKQIDIGPDFPEGVVPIFQHATARWFPDHSIAAKDWTDAYRQTIQAHRIFHDPYGIKQILTFGQIEPMVYKRKNAPLDYLNESRNEWNDPTSLDENYRYNVWELWEQALADGEQVVAAALRFLEEMTTKTHVTENHEQQSGQTQETAEAALIRVVGNRSYDTGKDCDSGLQIKYVNPIL